MNVDGDGLRARSRAGRELYVAIPAKPFDPTEMLTTIATAVRRYAPTDPNH